VCRLVAIPTLAGVPRLILLNGPPGCGKSTLARRYVEDHPLALNLDIDRIRDLLGRWPDHPHQAGLAARAIALAAARAHLRAGHDVMIPQYVGVMPTSA
jgi:predicted kinase